MIGDLGPVTDPHANAAPARMRARKLCPSWANTTMLETKRRLDRRSAQANLFSPRFPSVPTTPCRHKCQPIGSSTECQRKCPRPGSHSARCPAFWFVTAFISKVCMEVSPTTTSRAPQGSGPLASYKPGIRTQPALHYNARLAPRQRNQCIPRPLPEKEPS